MKRTVILFLFILTCLLVYSQDLSISDIDISDITRGKNNPWEYSPLCALDGKEETCFAKPRKNGGDPFCFRISLSEIVPIDSFSIEPGFF